MIIKILFLLLLIGIVALVYWQRKAQKKDMPNKTRTKNHENPIPLALREEACWKWQPMCDQGKWGYLNAEGVWKIPPKFEHANWFSRYGLAVVKINGEQFFLDCYGEIVAQPQIDAACVGVFSDNGLIMFRLEQRYGFFNHRGEVAIPAVFDYANDFSPNGLALVTFDQHRGFIDAQAHMQPFQFDNASPFSNNGLAPASIGGQWGYINSKGEFVIPPQFDDADFFSDNGLAMIEQNGLSGFVNEQGVIVIPAQFEYAVPFSSSATLVKKNGKYFYINQYGKRLDTPTNISQLEMDNFGSNGLVRAQQGKYGYLDLSGQWAIEPIYDWAQWFTRAGIAYVELDRKGFYINTKGERIFPSEQI